MIRRPEAHELRLRPASVADAYLLWLWANDAETRRASFGRAEIEWDAHVAWLAARVRSDAHMILIATARADQPVGVIRFDSVDAWQTARLSYAITAEQRGHGLADALVSAGTARLRELHHSVAIRADVERDNERSLCVFRNAGWTETADADGALGITFWYR